MGIEQRHIYRFEYLKSEEWQTVRASVLSKFEGKCSICGTFDLSNDVHHIFYPPNFWDTKPEHCTLLCRHCHKKVHLLMDNGISVNEKTLLSIRKFIESNRERKKLKIEKKRKRLERKLLKKPRCVCCHRMDLRLEKYVPSSMTRSKNHPMWQWCDACLAGFKLQDFKKWSEINTFFRQARKETKNFFIDKFFGKNE